MDMYIIQLHTLPQLGFASTVTTTNYFYRFHGHREMLEISLIEQGDICRYSKQRKVDVSEKSLNCILPYFIGHMQSRNPGVHKHSTVGIFADYTCTLIPDRYSDIEQALSQPHTFLLPESMRLSELDYSAVENVLHKLISKHITGKSQDRLACLSLWYQILSQMTSICLERLQASHSSLSASSHLYADKVSEYIIYNLAKRFTLSDIAKYFGVTPNYLNALFKSVKGQSIISFANHLRLEKVKELLLIKQLTLAEAGMQVGISDPDYLARLFKKKYGITSRQYLRLHHNMMVPGGNLQQYDWS